MPPVAVGKSSPLTRSSIRLPFPQCIYSFPKKPLHFVVLLKPCQGLEHHAVRVAVPAKVNRSHPRLPTNLQGLFISPTSQITLSKGIIRYPVRLASVPLHGWQDKRAGV